MKEFSGFSFTYKPNPACIWDEEGTNYEDLEGNDYPVNPFGEGSGDTEED